MIGIDVMSVNRFRKIHRNHFSKWKKFFNEDEWQYAFNRACPAMHLAGIFAAKEAVMKALGGDFMKRFDLIRIGHLPDGKPVALAKIRNKKARKVQISISHEGNVALAIALVIK